MKAILIIGSKGQVALALHRALKTRNVYTTARDASSLGPKQIFLDLQRPETIEAAFAEWESKTGGRGQVYLAGAMTNVDQCEREPELSWRINVAGSAAVAEQCKRAGHQLLFYSTEYVFGGAEYEGGAVGPFLETDLPFPTSVYGRHKLEAENLMGALLPSALIVRTTMVYSYDPVGTNFAMQAYRTLKAAQGPQVIPRIASDQISTPTYAPELAKASLQLMDQEERGIFHIVGKSLVSRPQFIAQLAEVFGVDSKLVSERFIWAKTAELNQVAKRPLRAGLRTEKAESKGIKLSSLQDSINEMAKQLA